MASKVSLYAQYEFYTVWFGPNDKVGDYRTRGEALTAALDAVERFPGSTAYIMGSYNEQMAVSSEPKAQ